MSTHGPVPSSPDADASRVLRVFISSTFRDMQAERDELVKRVFPQVRRLCEARGVTWAEVDLRWGVTDEQKAEGAVLPICLAEIDRTRPYFIGLLGQRYGWVPDELPPGLTERLGWLVDDDARSVTELEILHGVLNDPDAVGHAFFYLRDPGWVATRSPQEQSLLVEDDPAGVAKLDALKARIRASGHPVHDYPDPVALGDAVLADLTALVERLYPDVTPPAPLDRAAAEHHAFAASRFAGYVPRPALEARLDVHAEADQWPPLLVTGESGAGASALVSAWATRWRAEHPGDVVVAHHVGASAAAADWRALAARLVGELARAHGLDGHDAERLPDDAPALRAELAGVLRAAAAAGEDSGRRTILVLDGVDRLADEDGAPDLLWLPAELPVGLRVVLTSGAGRPLEVALHRQWATLEVPPLTDAERRTFVATFLGRFSKALDTTLVDRLVAGPLTGNALFLRTVLDELRQHGDHFTLGDQIDTLVHAATVDDLFELVLARYERDFERDRPGLVRDAFTAIWAARHGIAEAELLDLLAPCDAPLPHAVWSPLFLAAEQGLLTRSGLLGFATPHLRRAVEDRYLDSDVERRAAHRVLADHFAMQPLSDRVVDELTWQQLDAGDPAGAAATLADLEHTELAYIRAPRELRRMWARLTEAGQSIDATYADVIADPAAHETPARQLVWGIARLLSDAGHPDEALRLHEALVLDAQARPEGTRDVPGGDARLRAALINLGAALHNQSENDSAVPFLSDAVERSRAAGDDAMLAAALGNLACALRDLGQPDDALALFAEEEALCRARDDLHGLQASLGNRAELLARTGEPDAALELMAEQERLCRDVADRAGVGRALAARATILADRGDVALALALTVEFTDSCRELGDLRGQAEGLLNQTSMRHQLGDPTTLATADAAEALARQLDAPGLLARVLGLRAHALMADGAWSTVEPVAREAQAVANAAGLPAQVAQALAAIGTARRELGDLDGSRAAHQEQLRLAIDVHDPLATGFAHAQLAALDMATGDLDAALRHFAAAEAPYRAHQSWANLVPMLANRAQLHHMRQDLAPAVADYRGAAEAAARLGLHDAVRQWGEAAVPLAQHLQDAGSLESLVAVLTEAYRGSGDEAALQVALGERALLLLHRAGATTPGTHAVDRSLLDQAAGLLDEQETICRRLGEQTGLAACIGNRAIVLRHRGDIEGALRCVDEQAAIAQASGSGQGVLLATANRGELLGLLGRTDEALEALRWARQVAAANGIGAMVTQLDTMIAALGG